MSCGVASGVPAVPRRRNAWWSAQTPIAMPMRPSKITTNRAARSNNNVNDDDNGDDNSNNGGGGDSKTIDSAHNGRK